MVTDDSLHRRTVLSADGHAIGEVAHLLIDPEALQLVGVEVHVRRPIAERLQLPRNLFRGATLSIEREQIQSISDAVILTLPLDQLGSLHPPVTPAAGSAS